MIITLTITLLLLAQKISLLQLFHPLNQEVGPFLERIFQLIKLLYPHHDLHSVHFGIQSEIPEVRDNALEFLENILKPELRNLLVPTLDPDVNTSKRVQLANRLIGTNIETPTEALLTLIDHPEPWLKSCAAYTIGILGLTSLEANLTNAWNIPILCCVRPPGRQKSGWQHQRGIDMTEKRNEYSLTCGGAGYEK